MPGKFCPRCGKNTEEFFDSLCRDCFLQGKSAIRELPESIAIRKCRVCGKYSVEDKQMNSSNELLEDELARILNKPNIIGVSFRVDSKRNRLFLTVRSEFDGAEKEETAEMNVFSRSIICKYCTMRKTGYFQTILQIRLPKDLMDPVLDEVTKQLSFMSQLDPQAFVSRVQKAKDGVDLYIGSKKAANDIVKLLKRELGVKTKFSKKLAGKLKGKDVYRDTILVTVGKS